MALTGRFEIFTAVGEVLGKGVDHIGPDLIVSPARGRPDGADQVLRFGTVRFVQLYHRFAGDGLDGSTPPGMDGGECTGHRIGDEDRNAISGLYANKNI